MPVRVSAVRNATACVKVAVGDDELTVRYAPNRYTPRFEEQLQAAGEKSLSLARMVAALVIEWDLLGDEDEPYPLTQEALAELGVKFLSDVVGAIVRDVSPNPKSSAD